MFVFFLTNWRARRFVVSLIYIFFFATLCLCRLFDWAVCSYEPESRSWSVQPVQLEKVSCHVQPVEPSQDSNHDSLAFAVVSLWVSLVRGRNAWTPPLPASWCAGQSLRSKDDCKFQTNTRQLFFFRLISTTSGERLGNSPHIFKNMFSF